ncbi:trypsin-like peptidase domain-containing protein [Aestuariivita sp.]|uniref:trypsin-like peptidase domain-containing protein n=1 Tax=Aestuariivita sp. TaxID=1872407 RepID=UPI0025BD664B|nr:trypsin-like peptidase domain-containing protein [Aestuariivita sp.]
MKAYFTAFILTFLMLARPALAQQDVVWVQIEAQPSLSAAQDAARRYAGAMPDVNGFALGGGWYAVVLGPYLRADAERVLQIYRADRLIPNDSYIQLTSRLGQQFWPVGANTLGQVQTPQVTQETPQQPVVQAPAPQPTDESPADARRSEAQLTRDERRALQIALQWAGYYNAAIDGAFGRGTRGSMAAWQVDRGYPETGILTTAQRAELLADYNAPLTSVGMAMVRDDEAGIEMLLPMGEVTFETYEPPFAHYGTAGDLGARVLLISQPGDQTTLFGLYEIMQTLKIVPLEGPRRRGSDSFTLEGRNSAIVSYTEAALRDGQIKGFTLIWPSGDEPRRERVLAEMKASFARVEGVLDPATGSEAVQDIDLISGLEIRKPRVSRSGFFIDASGTVVTTSEVVESCTRITLEADVEAELVTEDRALGVAVLRPGAPLAPMSVARFVATQPRLQSDVAVAGYSYEGVLGAPSLTFGTLSDLKGLRGETELKRLALAALPGDAGGPVLDTGGTVLGMLLPRATRGPQLPGDVSFAANATAIGNVLADAGLSPQRAVNGAAITPTELSRVASGMTVLVSCWD